MATNRISGITIEFEGDTTKLASALKGVNKDLSTTQASLRDVDKLLKLDPGNVELLSQKQTLLNRAIDGVNEKLRIERDALAQLEAGDQTEETIRQQENLRREIIANEQQLKSYQGELEKTDQALSGNADATGELSDEMGEGASSAGDLAEGMGGMSAKAAMAAAAIAATIVVVKELAEAIIESAKAAASFGDEIATMSAQTGLSTDALQEYRYMAELIDVDVNTITGSLTKLTRNMQSAANGTGSAADAFAALGIEVTDSEGNLRSNQEVFAEVIDALGEMENATERDAYAMNIFGRSAQDLNPMILAGSDAIAAFAAEAHDVGYVLSEETIGSLGEMDDSFQRLTLAGDTLKNQLGAALAPTMTELIMQIVEMVQELQPLISLIADIVNGILSLLIPVLRSVTVFVRDNIIPGIQTVITWIKNTWTAAAEFFPRIRDEIKQKLGEAVDWIKSLPQQALQWGRDLLDNFAQGIREKFDNLVNSVKNMASTVRSYLHFSEPDVGPLSDFSSYAPDMVETFAKGILSSLPELRSAVGEMASTLSGSLSAPTLTQTLTLGNAEILAGLGALGDTFASGMGRLGIYLDGKTLVGYVNRNMGEVYG